MPLTFGGQNDLRKVTENGRRHRENKSQLNWMYLDSKYYILFSVFVAMIRFVKFTFAGFCDKIEINLPSEKISGCKSF